MDWRKFGKRFRATRPFTLTGAGWVFILYTIGVGAGAINTGNNLLYLAFGVFLGLIIASGALSDMSLWSLEAASVWPASVTAGEPAMIPVCVTNRKKYLPSICVTLQLEGELRGATLAGRSYLPYLGAGKSITLHVMLTPPTRGWFHARFVGFSTRYPFGLLSKRWTAASAPAFAGRPDRSRGTFVFPAPLELDRGGRASAAAGRAPAGASDRRGEGDNIYGLREFRDSDSPRRIDWKASAKRAGDPARPWVVRETEVDRPSEIALDWNAGAMAALPTDERERALRFGLALIDGYQRDGHAVRVFVTGADGRRAKVVLPADWAGEAEKEFAALWDPGGADTAADTYLAPAEAHETAERAVDIMALWRARGTAA